TTLAGLKKKLEPLAAEAKRTIAKFLAHLAEADGTVSPDEVKFLERVYKTLQVDAKLVYSDLHSASVPVKGALVSEAPKAAAAAGFVLDPERIAQLQKETEAVTALLANVFAEETAESQTVPVDEDEPAPKPGILGLDPSYVAFLRMLVSRPIWTRQELADIAADMELMLDGALEHINEAALDNFDAPLVDGDDPVEINQEILEKLPA
ncbi:MAG: Tellurite resistance protein TerB, partial [Betaproteobacteria bacterium]|nr:Tellurite resistance protein TerB [Betaproteobacteria bacterium]